MTLLSYTHPDGGLIEEAAWCDPEAVFAPHAENAGAIWLDSPPTDHPLARYSFILTDPYKVVRCDAAGDPLKPLEEALAAAGDIWHGLPDGLPPFRGGAVGFFAYELAQGFADFAPNAETLFVPPAPDDPPLMQVGLYGHGLAFDHHARRCFIFATGLPAAKRAQQARNDVAMWRDRLKTCRPLPQPAAIQTAPPRSNMGQAGFEAGVERIVAHILDGDVFQANLAQCLSAPLALENAFDFYRRLRRTAPAPFSAFMRFDDFAICSASPERFLARRNGRIETRPIKGTAARACDETADAQARAALEASAKDRAENIMIVDLMRNDLAKCCLDGSVRVETLCAVESFSNVHHLVSTITGQERPDARPLDVLRACFPGGSITGAPKRRAMEIIASLEPTRRGPYCGAIGFIGFDGALETSIAIRTALVGGGSVRFHAGGGIVADSRAAAEYAETRDKAAGFLAALGATQ